MNPLRAPAAYWLIGAIGLISVCLVALTFRPAAAPCRTDGTLEVHVSKTRWIVPEERAEGLLVERRDGYGHVCEPSDGVIKSELLGFNDLEQARVGIWLHPYRGGTQFSGRFSARCLEEPFVTITGENLGYQCDAYKALDDTVVRITFYSADWPQAKWQQLFGEVDQLLARRRKV